MSAVASVDPSSTTSSSKSCSVWASALRIAGPIVRSALNAGMTIEKTGRSAPMMEVAEDDLDVHDGVVSVAGDPARLGHASPRSPGRRPDQPVPAAGRAGRAVRATAVRRVAHDLPVRRAHRGRRGRPGYRAGAGAALPGGLRGRPGRQPDAGRGPAARRGGAGHRRRAAGGVLLRRIRPADGDHVHGLPDADRGRDPADRRPGLGAGPGPGQPAGRPRRGRRRHHRRRGGGGQRGARRAGRCRQRQRAAADTARGCGPWRKRRRRTAEPGHSRRTRNGPEHGRRRVDRSRCGSRARRGFTQQDGHGRRAHPAS